MKKHFIPVLFAAVVALFLSCGRDKTISALIVTGQNNTHDWKTSSAALEQILESSGVFVCDLAVSPAKGEDMSSFAPDFSDYKVVVIDYEGDPWSEKTNAAFSEYINNGGGAVIYHSSSIAFPDWKEYNEMTGLGGWGGRDEKSGPYIYFRNNSLVTDTAAGPAGTHGKKKEFLVRTRISDHPVTKGLPARWMHGTDELYGLLRGPGRDMQILATAFSDTTGGGTRRDEPMLMAISHGKGRVFHTAMGHVDTDGGPALHCVGFIVTLQRGAEWAATGEVKQPVPYDFPSAAGVVLRSGYKELTLDEAVSGLAEYVIGKSTRNMTLIQHHIRNNANDSGKLLEIEKMLAKVLTAETTTADARKLILRELSWMGSGYSVEAIRKLVNDGQVGDEAAFALERLESLQASK